MHRWAWSVPSPHTTSSRKIVGRRRGVPPSHVRSPGGRCRREPFAPSRGHPKVGASPPLVDPRALACVPTLSHRPSAPKGRRAMPFSASRPANRPCCRGHDRRSPGERSRSGAGRPANRPPFPESELGVLVAQLRGSSTPCRLPDRRCRSRRRRPVARSPMPEEPRLVDHPTPLTPSAPPSPTRLPGPASGAHPSRSPAGVVGVPRPPFVRAAPPPPHRRTGDLAMELWYVAPSGAALASWTGSDPDPRRPRGLLGSSRSPRPGRRALSGTPITLATTKPQVKRYF